MPLQNRLAELERKHLALKRQIEDALAHSSADDLEVVELKRKKLLLKDEIEKLKVEVARV